jgi:hypothetical protein
VDEFKQINERCPALSQSRDSSDNYYEPLTC